MTGLLETGRVARRLRLSTFRVRQLAKAGTLPVALVTAGGQRLFDPAAVETLRLARERERTARARKTTTENHPGAT